MKRFLPLALAALVLASCQKQTNSLTVNPTQLTFAAGDTGSKTVAVTTDARDWKAVANDTWIDFRQEGAALIVTLNEIYRGTEPREGSISITAGNADPVKITVKQEAMRSLSLSPSSLNFPAGQTGSKNVTVTTDAPEWNASYSAEWLKVSSTADGKLVVTVENLYYGSSAREAAITVTAGNATPATLTVSQSPTLNTLSFTPSSLEFGASETGSKNVVVNTDATRWTAEESVSWLTISTAAGSTLVVTVTETNSGESARTGTITVTAGSETKNLTVTQSGSSLSFGDIKYGSYSATGTPGFLDTPGPRTWTGTISPNSSGQYYELSNFGRDDISVRLKFDNGKIYMDGSYLAAYNDTHNGYFRVYWESGSNWTIMGSNYNHPVEYNKATRTLTFGSYVTTEASRPTAKVGVVAIPKSGNNYGVFTELYSGLTIRLTSGQTRAGEEQSTDGTTTRHEIIQYMREQ